jgi:hypothetical protein
VENTNPYAPPKAKLEAESDRICWRDNDVVVLRVGNDLPPRCIVCNVPVDGPIKKVRLHWHSPWLYLLILINVVIYVVVGIIARRSVKISPALCKDHALERRRRILRFLGMGGGALGLAFAFLMANLTGFALISFVGSLTILVIAMFLCRKVYAKAIKKDYARIGGCKEPFLASLERKAPLPLE